jgi:uncharacterized membrane protein
VFRPPQLRNGKPAALAWATLALLLGGCQRSPTQPLTTPLPSDGSAGATHLPPPASTFAGTSFRVVGVGTKDVLNLRGEPDAAASPIALIPPRAAHVEGLGAPKIVGQSSWQQVRYGGHAGWVNARFLALNANGPPPLPPPPAHIEALTPLVCFGTEPFWSLRFGADGTVGYYNFDQTISDDLRAAHIDLAADGAPQSVSITEGSTETWMQVSMAKTGTCSDGMSDGLHEFEFKGTQSQGSLLGCCRRGDGLRARD